MTSPYALELRDVVAGYGSVTVLRGVSLAVAPGSIVALLGPNGAGKTTLIRVAAGLLPRRSGEVWFAGRPDGGGPAVRRARRGLCVIPEGRGIFPSLTVRENLAMFVRGAGVGEAIDRSAAAFPVLRQRLGQIAGTLSGGEQQMLAVSRALVTDAEVVVADELSIGLAPRAIDEIFEAVELLRARGTSMLVVEQYVHRVLSLADYVYVLDRGEVAMLDEAARCDEASLAAAYLGASA